MLLDPTEIDIISRANQPGVRNPRRSNIAFIRILSDFFNTMELSGRRILDLGPGQYDFEELVRLRGGEVESIDNDPAVLALGHHRGFRVHQGDLRETRVLREHAGRFDGVFCKLSINAFWHADQLATLREHCRAVCDAARPHGWIWIAPWNGLSQQQRSPSDIRQILQSQIDAFQERGCQIVHLTPGLSNHYGVRGTTENAILALRNLPIPAKIRWKRTWSAMARLREAMGCGLARVAPLGCRGTP